MDTGVLRPEAVARSAEVINHLDVALRPFSVLPPFGEGHLRTSKSTSQVSQVFVAGTKCIKARLTHSPASTVRLRSSVSVRFLLRPYGSGTTRLKA